MVEKASFINDIHALNNVGGLQYGVSHASYGNMSFNYGDFGRVLANRDAFGRECGFKFWNTAYMLPKFGTELELIDGESKGRGAYDRATALNCDGLVTRSNSLILAMNPADCATVFLASKKTETIGLVHLGRENAVLEIGLELMKKFDSLGESPDDLVVGIGPSVEHCYKLQFFRPDDLEKWFHYISNPEEPFAEFKVRAFKTNPPKLEIRSISGAPIKVRFVDYFIDQLLSFGVPLRNIERSRNCTVCEARQGNLFSHQVSREFEGTRRADEFPEARNTAFIRRISQ